MGRDDARGRWLSRAAEEFLFGTNRAVLTRVRGPLWEIQGGRCFSDARLWRARDAFVPPDQAAIEAALIARSP